MKNVVKDTLEFIAKKWLAKIYSFISLVDRKLLITMIYNYG